MASALNVFLKHPVETYAIGMDYTTAAPTGAILISGVWQAEDTQDLSDATGVVLANSTAVIDAQVAKGQVQAGTLDRTYKLGITVTFDTGDVLHDDVFMQVDEAG